MADITRNSFNAANNFHKVLYQRAMDVLDSELNESQDITRHLLYAMAKHGLDAGTDYSVKSNGPGWKAVANGTAKLTISAGVAFVEGVPITNEQSFQVDLPEAPDGEDRLDYLYLIVNEEEVPDPSPVPELGETTRRVRLSVGTGFAEAVPTSSPDDLWNGGTKYYALCTVQRTDGVDYVTDDDLVDLRKKLPASILGSIVHQVPGEANADPGYIGNWMASVGDGLTSFGDFNTGGGVNGIRKALDYYASLTTWLGFSLCAKIHVKQGNYNVIADSSSILMLRGTYDVTLTGDGPSATRINDYTGGAALVIDADCSRFSKSTLRLENLWLSTQDSSTTDALIGNSATTGISPNICLDGCVVDGDINIKSPSHNPRLTPKLLIRNSSLGNSDGSNTSGNGVINLIVSRAAGDYVPAMGAAPDCVIVSESRFSCKNGQPILSLTSNGTTPTGDLNVVGLISFTKCTGVLPGLAATDEESHTQGVLKFDLEADTVARFDEIMFEHCNFSSVKSASTGSNVLMNLVVPDSTVPPIRKLSIIGGRWLAEGGAANKYAPFYIGPATHARETSKLAVGAITVIDTVFGWSSAVVGASCTNISHAVSSTPTDANCAFTFSADSVRMHGISFTGCALKSTFSDLAVVANAMDVSGVDIKRPLRTLGVGSAPSSRCYFAYCNKGSAARYANVDLVTLIGASAEELTSGSGVVIKTKDLDSSSSSSKQRATITRCRVTNNSAGYTFRVPGGSIGSKRFIRQTYRHNSVIGCVDTPFLFEGHDTAGYQFSFLDVADNEVRDVSASAGRGIHVDIGTLNSEDQRINVRDNFIDGALGCGITVYTDSTDAPADFNKEVRIAGNFVYNTGDYNIELGRAATGVLVIHGLILGNTGDGAIRLLLQSGGSSPNIIVRGITDAIALTQGGSGNSHSNFMSWLTN